MGSDILPGQNLPKTGKIVCPAKGMTGLFLGGQSVMDNGDTCTFIFGRQNDFQTAHVRRKACRTLPAPTNDEPMGRRYLDISTFNDPVFKPQQKNATGFRIDRCFVAHPGHDGFRLGKVSEDHILPCMDDYGMAIGLNCHAGSPRHI